MSSLLDFLEGTKVALPEETVHVAEWGKDVTLRGFTSRERDAFEEENLKRATAKQKGNGTGRQKRGADLRPDLDNFRARLVAQTIVEDDKRTFANPRGEALLGRQAASVIDHLFGVAQRLNGMSDQDVEEMIENFEPTRDDAGSTDSPLLSGAPSAISSPGSRSGN